MERKRITDIFSGTRWLKIPFFQRSYVWDEKNWERFLDDMISVSQANRDYFLGTYIMKQEPTPCSSGISDIRVVIDGQQRITTLVLFFYSLFKKSGQVVMFDRIFKTISNDLAVKHNRNDVEIFEAILTDNLTQELKDKYAKNNVFRAFDYFNDHIELGKLDFRKILDRVYFVGIDLQQDDNEQQIFDTINSLGTRLTTAELLKNLMFNANEIDLYNRTWASIFEFDPKCKDFWDMDVTLGRIQRTNIDLLLSSYLTIKRDADFKIEELFDNFKEFLKESDYENNKEKILKDLKEYADIYHTNINYNCCNEPLNVNDGKLSRLNIVFFGLETTTLIPYCLYILKNADENEQDGIFTLLEKYVLRRLICKFSTKNYNNFFKSLIKNEVKTEEKLKEIIYNEDCSENNEMPSDEDLMSKIVSADHTNKKAKGILYLLESALRNKNDCTELKQLNSYDLEHIMPKDFSKWGIPESENPKQAEANRKAHINLLGNKTLLSSPLNKSIKNAIWSDKVNGIPDKKIPGYNDYAKGLKTFSFEGINEWNEDEIEKRNKSLLDNIKSVWSID